MNLKFILFSLILAALTYLSYIVWFQLGRAPKPTTLAHKVTSNQLQYGLFQNEIDTPMQAESFSYTKMMHEMISPSSKNRRPPADIPNLKIDLHDLSNQTPSIVWFGHSSYLLTFSDMNILVDPVMSGYSSPLPFLVKSFTGTDIYSVDDLPKIDVLLITHDHYDHLDYETVTSLKNKVSRVVAPIGVGEHLQFWGYEANKITELNWHENVTIASHTITATPARHFSGRGFSRNQTLWASYVISNPTYKLYVGGDSGYGPHFKAIGEQYGPFNLALLESGQYNKDWPFIHMQPEETVQAAQDLQAQVLMPVHWGKFVLSLHDWDEPIKRLTQAASAAQQKIITPTLGQATALTNDYPDNPWWKTVQLN